MTDVRPADRFLPSKGFCLDSVCFLDRDPDAFGQISTGIVTPVPGNLVELTDPAQAASEPKAAEVSRK
jgi:hypothetical protein